MQPSGIFFRSRGKAIQCHAVGYNMYAASGFFKCFKVLFHSGGNGNHGVRSGKNRLCYSLRFVFKR